MEDTDAPVSESFSLPAINSLDVLHRSRSIKPLLPVSCRLSKAFAALRDGARRVQREGILQRTKNMQVPKFRALRHEHFPFYVEED